MVGDTSSSRVEFRDFTSLPVSLHKKILQWRNNQEVRKWMFTDRAIAQDEHSRFVKKLSNNKQKRYWVACVNAIPVGVVYIDFSIQSNTEATLGMYIAPEWQGKGFGTIVLSNFITSLAPSLGVQSLWLELYVENQAARRLYSNQGFTEFGKPKTTTKGKVIRMKKELQPKHLQIGERKVGPGHPVYIVAELSCNHVQKFDVAVKTIEAIAKCGVDAVKIQTYKPETMTIDCDKPDFQIKQGTIWDGTTFYSLYEEAYTPWEWQPKLQRIARELGLDFFSSPFDITAVDFLAELDVPVYKVASFEIKDIPLVRKIAQQGKPVIISTGIAKKADIELAVQTCRDAGNNQIALLKCTSAYPTPFEDVNLLTMPDLKTAFDVVVGLSDHTMGSVVPIAAVALGASIVEKHFILDRSLGGPDSQFSMEPDEFSAMANSVRETQKALGEVTYKLSESSKKAETIGRSLYVVENVKAGEVFSERNVRSIRPGYGLAPKYFDQILGKHAKVDIERGTRFSLDLLQEGL